MKKISVILWFWWWLVVGQCLCDKPLTWHRASNLRPTVSSTRHNGSGQWLPSLNNSLIGKNSSQNNAQPAPGITESTYYNKEKTPYSTHPVTHSEKVHNGVLKKNLSEHVIPSPKPTLNINNNDNNNNAHKNTSSGGDTTIDKNASKPLPEDLPKEDIHTNHNHNPVYEAGSLPVLRSINTEKEREGHGRVITTTKDLCSFCLCDGTKENVYCKQNPTNHTNISPLRLTDHIIPPSAITLHIVGYPRMVIEKNTFSRPDLRLRSIHFEDITSMELLSKSLHFSPHAEENMEVVVIFTNCSIPEMPQQTFTQQTSSEDPWIKLERTRFMSLTIERSTIEKVRSYALYNVRLLYFQMIGTKIEIMEENSIHLDSYEEWIIKDTHLPHMIEKTICIQAQSVVEFSNNTFYGIGSRSMSIISSSQVLFKFNKVLHLESEALLSIQPHRDARAANIVFLNNTIVKADERSLLTDKQYPMHELKIINNKFNIPCDCLVKEAFESLLGITNMSDYQDIAIFKAVTRKSLCQVFGGAYIKVQTHINQQCTLPIAAIAAGTAVGVVILILVVVCVVCNRRVQKARDEANYLGECCFSQSFSTLHSNPQPLMTPVTGPPSQPLDPTYPIQPWIVAVPEVKTYQETEINVSYEHTEPMNVSIRDSSYLEPGQILDLQRRTQMRSSCPFN